LSIVPCFACSWIGTSEWIFTNISSVKVLVWSIQLCNISSTCSWVSYGLAEGRKSVKEISHLSLFLLAQHAVKDDVKCWCPNRKVNLGWMNLRCARYILVCLNPF
jgi:hypothetical protein